MLDKLKKLLQTVPIKQIGSKIKKDKELYSWLISVTIHLTQKPSISERVYVVVNSINSDLCEKGNKLKFKGLKQGFGFCGKSSICQCARESISKKVSESKNNYNNEKKTEINEKRIETNLKKYGVENAGQLSQSKQKHKDFYSNEELVSTQVKKQQQTLLDRYGVKNPAHIPGISKRKKETNLKKYGVENISQTSMSRQRTSKLSKQTWKNRKESNLDYNKLVKKYKEKCYVEFITSSDSYKGSVGAHYYDFKCLKCNTEFKNYIYCGHLPICKKCNPTIYKFKSNEENEIFNFLLSTGIEVEQRNRTLIYPSELDIVSHDKKIAIEYCGIYWHSELSHNKTSQYHLDKLKKCQEHGYKLITIFSDEWVYKKNIVKDKLLTTFGVSSNNRINARECEIKIIDNKLSKLFYESYHIQGSANGLINLGLYYNNDLVSCMTFCKQRAFISSIKQDNTYELLRYASSNIVRGGAGKLLKYFEKETKPRKIISYADARWSTGQLYNTLGFNCTNVLNPGYWYTNDYSNRLHRFNFTKSKLVKQGNDPALTEWEIMQKLGYDRIWDCGQYRFEKNYAY